MTGKIFFDKEIIKKEIFFNKHNKFDAYMVPYFKFQYIHGMHVFVKIGFFLGF